MNCYRNLVLAVLFLIIAGPLPAPYYNGQYFDMYDGWYYDSSNAEALDKTGIFCMDYANDIIPDYTKKKECVVRSIVKLPDELWDGTRTATFKRASRASENGYTLCLADRRYQGYRVGMSVRDVIWVQGGTVQVDPGDPTAVRWMIAGQADCVGRLRVSPRGTFKTNGADMRIGAIVHDDNIYNPTQPELQADDGTNYEEWMDVVHNSASVRATYWYLLNMPYKDKWNAGLNFWKNHPSNTYNYGGTVAIGYHNGTSGAGGITINSSERTIKAGYFCGTLVNGSRVGGGTYGGYIEKWGAGTQIFSGDSSGYTGTCNVNEGNIQLGDSTEVSPPHSTKIGADINVTSSTATLMFRVGNQRDMMTNADIGGNLHFVYDSKLDLELAKHPRLQNRMDVGGSFTYGSRDLIGGASYIAGVIHEYNRPGLYIIAKSRRPATYSGVLTPTSNIRKTNSLFKPRTLFNYTENGNDVDLRVIEVTRTNGPAMLVQKTLQGIDPTTFDSDYLPNNDTWSGWGLGAVETVINMGSTHVRETPALSTTYKIRNYGNETLNITSLISTNVEFTATLSNTSIAPYYLPDGEPSNSYADLTITFRPQTTSSGARSSSIRIVSNDSNDPNHGGRFEAYANATVEASGLSVEVSTPAGVFIPAREISAPTNELFAQFQSWQAAEDWYVSQVSSTNNFKITYWDGSRVMKAEEQAVSVSPGSSTATRYATLRPSFNIANPRWLNPAGAASNAADIRTWVGASSYQNLLNRKIYAKCHSETSARLAIATQPDNSAISFYDAVNDNTKWLCKTASGLQIRDDDSTSSLRRAGFSNIIVGSAAPQPPQHSAEYNSLEAATAALSSMSHSTAIAYYDEATDSVRWLCKNYQSQIVNRSNVTADTLRSEEYINVIEGNSSSSTAFEMPGTIYYLPMGAANPVRTSSTRTVTLRNTSNQTMKLGALTSANSEFTLRSDRSEIAAGGSATLTITFTPQRAGYRSSVIELTSDQGGRTLIVSANTLSNAISITQESPAPARRLEGLSTSLGITYADADNSWSYTVTNNSALQINGLGFRSSNPAFSTSLLDANSAPISTLAPGASATLRMNLQGSQLAMGNHEISIEAFDAAGTLLPRFALTITKSPPHYALAVTYLGTIVNSGSDFKVGRSPTPLSLNLAVTNNGTNNLTGINFALNGMNPEDYRLTLKDATGTNIISNLPVGGRGLINISYNAGAVSLKRSRCSFTLNSTQQAALFSLNLDAMKIASAEAQLEIVDLNTDPPTTMASGFDTIFTLPTTKLGESSVRRLQLRNIGGGALRITGLTRLGTVPPYYIDPHFTINNSRSILAGVSDDYEVSSSDLTVTFAPQPLTGPDTAGEVSASLTILNQRGYGAYENLPPHELTLKGRSTTNAMLSLEDLGEAPPRPLAMGSTVILPTVPVGGSSSRQFKITNSGTGTLNIKAIQVNNDAYTVTDAYDRPFAAPSPGRILISLAPSESWTIHLYFDHQGSPGQFNGSLRITSNAILPVLETGLQCSAVNQTLILQDRQSQPARTIANGSTINFPDTLFGETSTLTYTLVNENTNPLSIRPYIQGVNNIEFSLQISQPNGTLIELNEDSVLSAGSSTTLVLTFRPISSSSFEPRRCGLSLGSGSFTSLDFQLSATPSSSGLHIKTSSLPEATINQEYAASLTAGGGTPPYQWSLASGSLPAGLTLNSEGVISGSPLNLLSEQYSFTARLRDADGAEGEASYTLLLNGMDSALKLNNPALVQAAGIPNQSTLVLTPAYLMAGGNTTNYTLTNLTDAPVDASILLSGRDRENFTARLLDANQQNISILRARSSASLRITFEVLSGEPGERIADLAIGTGLRRSLQFHLSADAMASTLFRQPADLGTVNRQESPMNLELLNTNDWAITSCDLISGAIPPGLSLSRTGVLAGTPTEAGTYTFQINAVSSQPAISANREFTLNIFGLNRRNFTASQINADPITLTATMAALGGSGSCSYRLLTANSPVTLSNDTLTLKTANAGNYPIRLEAVDNKNHRIAETITLSVFGITSSATQQLIVNQRATIAVTALGGTGTLTWSAIGLPADLNLDTTNGLISGLLDAPAQVNYTLQAADSAGNITTKQMSLLALSPSLEVRDITFDQENPENLQNGDLLLMSATASELVVTHKLKLSNLGGNNLTLGGFTLAAPNNADFSLSLSDLNDNPLPSNITLSPAALRADIPSSCLLYIHFRPSRDVNILRSNRLLISTNDPGLPTYSIELSGQCLNRGLLPQSISWINPGPLHVGQGDVPLTVYANGSGLPVSLQLSQTEAASLSGNAQQGYRLTPKAPGSITLAATQEGNQVYAPAKPIRINITIRKEPIALTLGNLRQTYDGSPKRVTILPSSIPAQQLSVSYTLGGKPLAGDTNPLHAGTYGVQVTYNPPEGEKLSLTGSLLISKAPLLLRINNLQRRVLQSNPPLTYTLFNPQRGEIISDANAFWTTRPLLGTRAVPTSPVGIYPITLSNQPLSTNFLPLPIAGALMIEGFGSNLQAMVNDAADAAPVGIIQLTNTSTKSSPGASKGAPPILRSNFSATVAQSLNPKVTKARFSGSFHLTAGGDALTSTKKLTDSASGISLSDISIKRDGSFSGTLAYLDKTYPFIGNRLLEVSEAPQPYAGTHSMILEGGSLSHNGNMPTLLQAPLGQGYASLNIRKDGTILMTGRLGDNQAFTAALPGDTLPDPGYRIFIQPYRSKQGAFGGSFQLAPVANAPNKRYLAGTSLRWIKARDTNEKLYANGFDLKTICRIDAWQQPNSLAPLQQLMGINENTLTFSATDEESITISIENNTLKSSGANLKFAPKTGLFSGTKTIPAQNGLPARTLTFSGSLRQPSSGKGNNPSLLGAGMLSVPSSNKGQQRLSAKVSTNQDP